MEKAGKTLLTILFAVIIFSIGALTLYQSYGALKDIVRSSSIPEMPDKIETVIQQNFAVRNTWINFNGLVQKCLLKTVIKDPSYTVYKLNNGQVMYGLPERDMTDYADRVAGFKDKVEETGAKFLYVQIPNKIKDDSYMPVGTHTYGNSNADQLVSLLRERDIDTLDLREKIAEEGFDWSSLFFMTDHHWRPKTGLWASGEIMKYVSDNYGFDVDMSHYDYDSYNSTVYKNWMLGAVGRRTGYWYSGLDDIEILDPKFDTDFYFWAKSKDGIRECSGSFYDTMFLWDNLKTRADFVNNSYSTYIGKEYSKNVIKNKKSSNGLKILWIKESFSLVLVPFISNDCEEITTIDLRRYKKKSMVEYCREYKPDLVVVAYNPSAFSKKQFNFE